MTLPVRSKISHTDPINYETTPTDGFTLEYRGLCPFVITKPVWSLNAAVTVPETASITHVVNRILQQSNGFQRAGLQSQHHRAADYRFEPADATARDQYRKRASHLVSRHRKWSVRTAGRKFDCLRGL